MAFVLMCFCFCLFVILSIDKRNTTDDEIDPDHEIDQVEEIIETTKVTFYLQWL